MEKYRRMLPLMKLWSFIGTLLIIAIGSALLKVNYYKILEDFFGFLMGNYKISYFGNDTLESVRYVMGIIIIIFTFNLLLMGILSKFMKIPIPILPENPKPYKIIPTILIEELFARVLFLSILTQIFHGKEAFFILFLAGNTIWSLLHFLNYEKKERRFVSVVPIFIIGLFMTFIYVKFGFWVTFICHLYFDLIVFSAAKRFPIIQEYLYQIIFSFVILITLRGILFFSNPGVFQWEDWLNGKFVHNFANYNFWSYFLAYLVVIYANKLICNVLLYDPPSNETETTIKTGGFKEPLKVLILSLLILNFSNWFLDTQGVGILMKALLISIIVALPFTSKYLYYSGITRLCFFNIAPVFMYIVVSSIFNFWLASLMLILEEIIYQASLIFKAEYFNHIIFVDFLKPKEPSQE